MTQQTNNFRRLCQEEINAVQFFEEHREAGAWDYINNAKSEAEMNNIVEYWVERIRDWASD